jgi:hypothetical protein
LAAGYVRRLASWSTDKIPVNAGNSAYTEGVLTKTEIVWRELLVGFYERDERRQGTITDLAGRLGLAVSTAHRALARPEEMGAVEVSLRTGITLLSPPRLLVLWAAHRRPLADEVARIQTSLTARDAEDALSGHEGTVLGGFGAAVAHMGGNTVSAYDTVLCYGSPGSATHVPAAAEGRGQATVVVMQPDPLLATYGRVTPLPQTYVDLFNQPSWQAARFVNELDRQMVLPYAA